MNTKWKIVTGTHTILIKGDGLTTQGIAQDREIFLVSLVFLLFSSLISFRN